MKLRVSNIDTCPLSGKLKVMMAAENGEKIAVWPFSKPEQEYVECENPTWNWGVADYQLILPEPIVTYGVYHGNTLVYVHVDKKVTEDAKTRYYPNGRVIKLVEET